MELSLKKLETSVRPADDTQRFSNIVTAVFETHEPKITKTSNQYKHWRIVVTVGGGYIQEVYLHRKNHENWLDVLVLKDVHFNKGVDSLPAILKSLVHYCMYSHYTGRHLTFSDSGLCKDFLRILDRYAGKSSAAMSPVVGIIVSAVYESRAYLPVKKMVTWKMQSEKKGSVAC